MMKNSEEREREREDIKKEKRSRKIKNCQNLSCKMRERVKRMKREGERKF